MMTETERKLLDAVNAETVRRCLANIAASPKRTWNGPPLSDIGRHDEAVEKYDHGLVAHVCKAPSLCEHFVP